jgi:hypothetical protein
VNTYPASVHPFTKPATTTPPPHREHRPATLFSSPPLVSFLRWICDVETRRLLKLAWMLAFKPRNCRTATDGAPEPLVLLSAAVAVRGTCEVSTLRRAVLWRPRSVATPSREVRRSRCWHLAAPLFAEPRETPRRAAVPRGGDAPSLVFWRFGLRAVFFFRSWMFACVQAGRTLVRRGHDLAVEMPGASALHVAPRAAAGVSGSRPSRRGFVFLAGTIVRAFRVVRTPAPRPGNATPLGLRSSRGASVFRRRALRTVPSCEPAFEPSRPCVEC